MASTNDIALGYLHRLMPNGGAPTFSNQSLNASNQGIAAAFQAMSGDQITHVGFLYGSRTGTPPTYVATLEGISATTGAPDGTDVGGGSATAVTFTPPADTTWNSTIQWVQLTNAYTPTRGQRFALTIRYSSGTVNGSNFSSFTHSLAGAGPSLNWYSFPIGQTLTAGTWAKSGLQPIYGIRTSSYRYGNIFQGFYTTRSASTVGHRKAMAFSLPSGSGSTYTVKGFRFSGSLSSATGKNPILGIWNTAGTKLQDVTLDADWVGFPTLGYENYEFFFDETTLTALSFGTVYYIGLEVGDATSGDVLLNGLQLNSSSDLTAFPGGSAFYLGSWTGSAWTDDTTVRPYGGLILDDWTGSSGGRPYADRSNLPSGLGSMG